MTAKVFKSPVNAFRQQRGNDIIPEHPIERLRPLQVDVELRKSTFASWPKSSIISPQKLYNNGFYYMGIKDKVQCAFCGGVLSDWQKDDDVEKEHARHFGQCELVKVRKDSRRMLFSQSERESSIVTSPEPRYRDFVLYNDRLSSFKNWPIQCNQKPHTLAQAGLFFTGTSDKCQCYMCGGILSGWESDDVPIDEHRKWFPKCPLLSN